MSSSTSSKAEAGFDQEARELGGAIRARRTELGMTVGRLADAAGVSRSLISQVERGLASPSITTLRRIAAALGVPVVALFAGAANASSSCFDREGKRVIVRSYERKSLYRPGSVNVVYELLTPDFDRQVEFMRIEIGPHTSTPAEVSQHAGEENQLCLEGTYVLVIEGEEFIVNEGDSISFDAGRPHRAENRTDQRVVLVTAISPPNF
ncbi:MAG: helix-turn-helix domain-containing protein [Thermoleophilia bacterium]